MSTSLNFSTKTYAVGTQKNRLKEVVLLGIQNRFNPTGLPLTFKSRKSNFLPLKFGSPIEFFGKSFCDTVAVWHIIKLALKNNINILEIILLCSLR